MGDKKAADIPDFFSSRAKIKIQELREKFGNPVLEKLQAALNNLVAFDIGVEDSQDKEIFAALRSSASMELSYLLITKCFSEAWKTFPWKRYE